MKEYRNYRLGRITGKCPACGQRRFKYYVDGNGRIIDENCGRCNRENRCGYHRTPRDLGYGKPDTPVAVTVVRTTEPSLMPSPELKKTYCPLSQYLRRLFDDSEVDFWCAAMGVDTYHKDPRMTVFWLQDSKRRVRSAKLMAYGDDGHRLHGASDTCYLHTATHLKDYDYEACFFGEHLAARFPDRTIILVESEKTALMMNIMMEREGYISRYICLATSGATNLSLTRDRMDDPWYRLSILRGRKVVLLPDADMVDRWHDYATALKPYTESLTVLDTRRPPFMLTGSEDVADYIERLRLADAPQQNEPTEPIKEDTMKEENADAVETVEEVENTVAEEVAVDAVEVADPVAIEPAGEIVLRPVSEWMQSAAARPDHVPLWKNLWYENEICCLFADTNVGKSILAVQIADEVSRHRNVAYFDFEMTDKQFQKRYSDDATGRLHAFSDRFYRGELSTSYSYRDLEGIIDLIRLYAERCRCKAIIIDNITWLCNRCEEGEAAGRLMQMLVKLKRDHGFSILVLAHTPKNYGGVTGITIDRLAGSKRIANFMDAVFALGISERDTATERYLIQLKSRSSVIEYTAQNVMVLRLVKDGSMLRMRPEGFATERALLGLKETRDETREKRRREIMERLAQGQSYSQIQDEMQVSSKLIAEVRKQLGDAA